MSFMDSSASTSQPNGNNLMNFNSPPAGCSVICENRSEFLIDSNKSVKFPRSAEHDTRNMDFCYDYNKSYGNTFQYSGNSFGYDDQNSYGLNATVNQPLNSTNPYGYNFNKESHDQQNQPGKFRILTESICWLTFELRSVIVSAVWRWYEQCSVSKCLYVVCNSCHCSLYKNCTCQSNCDGEKFHFINSDICFNWCRLNIEAKKKKNNILLAFNYCIGFVL